MQKLKRSYEDSRAAHRNLGKINTELQDVQRIMMKNIDDVLDRGSALDCRSQPPQRRRHKFRHATLTPSSSPNSTQR